MGDFVQDEHVAGLLGALNLRFGPKDAIKELASLQKEYKVFHKNKTLRSSFSLLNIGPLENWTQRRGWYNYLDHLKTRQSDVQGKNSHDRLIDALSKHLAAEEPLPVHFTAHASSENEGVIIEQPHLPLVYSTQEYLTISLPTTPVEWNRAKRRAKK